MLGRTEGTRKQGRPATRWLDTITLTTTRTLAELNQLAQDRSSYRSFIQQVAMARNTS